MSESDGSNNRIKYAYFLHGWCPKTGSKSVLASTARKVLVSEYEPRMDQHLFCPGCFTNLVRIPKDKAVFSNGRKACFAHIPTYRSVLCDLRSTKPEGKHYVDEEQAKQAIEDHELVVVSSFLDTPPDASELKSGVYEQTPVEDLDGPISNVPIARHTGETFHLPTKISTVNSLCRNFDYNLYRYYVFPGQRAATRLVDALVNIRNVTETTDTPRLYYERIRHSFNAGRSPKPSNLRMTELFASGAVKDFYLKDVDSIQTEKGISDTSVNRIVLIWGVVTWNGIGLCINRPKWGEYALLPSKYDALLEDA